MRILGATLVSLVLLTATPTLISAHWSPARPDEYPLTSFVRVAAVPDTFLWATMRHADDSIEEESFFRVGKSRDGGRNWEVVYQQSAVGGGPWTGAIAATDSLHAVAIPQDRIPRILVTFDGGASWQDITLPIPGLGRLDDVCFTDSHHGWMAATLAGAAFVLFSNDGGLTWAVQTSPAFPGSGKMQGVAFADSLIGWAAATAHPNSLSVFATQDGGLTWLLDTTVEYGPFREVQELTVLPNGSHGWLAIYDASFLPGEARLYGRDPMVAGWHLLADGMELEGLGCQEIAFTSPSAGLFLGYVPYTEYAAYMTTTDGGHTWSPFFFPGVGMYGNTLAMHESGLGWVLGHSSSYRGGLVLRTPDTGGSWQTLRWSDEFVAVDFPGVENGWAAGMNGCILRTRDRGETWALEDWAGRYPMMVWDMDFADSTHGFMAARDTDGSTPLLVTDGSGTWSTRRILDFVAIDSDVRSLAFPTPEVGYLSELWWWALVWESRLYKTENGGLDWARCLTDSVFGAPPGSSGSLSFVNADTGWVLVRPDAIHRTLDGGDTWGVFFIDPLGPPNAEAKAVQFLNASEGWILSRVYGDQSMIYHSLDGGETWTLLSVIPMGENVPTSIFFRDSMNGWITQVDGPILFTQDGGVTWLPDSFPGDPLLLNRVFAQDAEHAWAVGRDDILRYELPLVVPSGEPAPASGQSFAHLSQNPFRGGASLAVTIPGGPSRVVVRVFDTAGRCVRTLFDGHAARSLRVVWDGKTDAGERAASGVYFFRVETEVGSGVVKGVLVR